MGEGHWIVVGEFVGVLRKYEDRESADVLFRGMEWMDKEGRRWRLKVKRINFETGLFMFVIEREDC